MGGRRLAVVHADRGIPWHRERAQQFVDGLRAIGIHAHVAESRTRVSAAPAILFGTTLWQQIERDDGAHLLVDRASVGDPHYVTLGWNGRGRLADYRVPAGHDASRWEALGVELQPARSGDAVVICGEWDGSHPDVPGTHFRPHPAGGNPTRLPAVKDWIDGEYHGLRSSVLVEAVIRGYPTVAHDRSSMIHGMRDRERWAHWVAWTQWSWDEIRQGTPIGHLFA